MDPLKTLVLTRHSTRAFLPDPVPPHLLREALSLSQHSPSNSNIQPWHLTLATGPALTRLTTALLLAANTSTPNIPPLPPQFAPLRAKMGELVFGTGMGIARSDHPARHAAVLRNYAFFGAPAAAIVCLHRDLGAPDALSVGMYLQTLLLALAGLGVGTCVEVSVAGYPDVLREQLGIPDEMRVLCGVAIGFEDGDAGVNQVRCGRLPVGESVVFREE